MKWKFFKRDKARPSRFALSNRRVTGVVTDLPRGMKVSLFLLVFTIGVAVSGWGSWKLFETYYFRSHTLFVLRDLRNSVTITTGKTLTPELVCEVLGIREGINLFTLKIEQKRQELLEQAPNIRDITIVRRMPDKINITIIEREPIARVSANGRVVDEEGVVFIRYAGTGGLPMIKGDDEFAQIKPGDRVQGNEMAAVRLVNNTLRPVCRLRILVVDTTKEDYLLLTLSDHRQAKFAWDGMQDEKKDTEAKMQKQFDHLEKAMENEMGRGRLMWNAMLPGRIFAMPPGVQ
ncbi:MAG: FtsQ-type POTRA domain-containing protein [bacterium]